MKKIFLLVISIFALASTSTAQWQMTDLPQASYISCIVSTPTRILAGTWADYGLYKSDDNGLTWDVTTLNYPIIWLYINGSDIYASTSGFGLFRSSDNGDTWTSLNNGLNAKSVVYSVISNGTTLFAATDFYGVFRSTDNGASWTAVNKGLPLDYLERVTFCDAFAANGTTIFVGTFNGIFRSTDNGDSWTAVNNGLDVANLKTYIMAQSGSKIYAGTWGGGVFSTTDNGTNWTSMNTGLESTNKKINSLTVSGTNIFAGTAKNGIYASTVNSSTWTNISSNIPIYLVNSIAVVGTDIYTGVGETSNTFLWKRPLSEVAIAAGIGTVSDNDGVSFYPNPVKNELTIEMSSSINETSYEILDLSGKILWTSNIDKKATVNVSKFPLGVYVLKVTTDNKTTVKKFVKQ